MSARTALGPLAACGLLVLAALAGCSAQSVPDDGSPASATAMPVADTTMPVRLTTMEQWLGAVAGCLQDRGWDAQVDGTGRAIELDELPVEQREAFAADNAACESEAGLAPNASPPTEQQIRAQYQHLVDAVECIRSHGIEVAESTPPSEEKFVDDYLSGNAPWSPFVNLPDMSQSAWEQLNRECPQAIDGI